MNKPLIDVVLPRLAKTLYRQLQRYRAGQLNESQFTHCFEALLRQHHSWLTEHGVSDVRAAIALHGAVLVLSGPGLRAEAAGSGVPMEVIERRAICDAAADVARNYGMAEPQAFRMIASVVARYGN